MWLGTIAKFGIKNLVLGFRLAGISQNLMLRWFICYLELWQILTYFKEIFLKSFLISRYLESSFVVNYKRSNFGWSWLNQIWLLENVIMIVLHVSINVSSTTWPNIFRSVIGSDSAFLVISLSCLHLEPEYFFELFLNTKTQQSTSVL